MNGLQFQAEGHTYHAGGRRVVGVTENMKAAGMTSEYYLNDTARDFGSNLHRTIELMETGRLGDYDPTFEPWLDGYRRFLDDYDWLIPFEIDGRHIEVQLYCPTYRFAGQIDRLFYDDEKEAILVVDWKTGSLAPTWGVQGAAYEWLVKVNTPHDMQGTRTLFWPVQILPGKYKVHAPRDPWRLRFNVFQSALTVHQWRQDHNLLEDWK